MVEGIGGEQAIWVLLVEHGLESGSDAALFWHESDAVDAARRYLAQAWPAEDLETAADVREAIEAANQLVGDEEYIVLAPFPVAGNQHFEGPVDDRPRCRSCGEPIELNDVRDPDSWIHCIDAHDGGDHTAAGPVP